jgi:proline iminopeptidase
MAVTAVVLTEDGHRLWTETAGRGDPVVLCHGGPGLWDMFGDLAGMLADVRTVHRWDQRGCGRSQDRSQPGGPHSVARSVADLDTVRRHFGHERMALLGHSWGAQLALRYALDHPDRVTRLVYLSGTGLSADSWRDEFHAASDRRLGADRTRLDELEAGSAAGQREAAVLRWSIDFADRARAREHAEAMATPWFPINWEANRAIDAEMRATWREPELVAECRELPVPTLILEGAEDIRPRWAVDSLAAALPTGTRVTLDGVGHLPWLEAPEATAEALRGFLA